MLSGCSLHAAVPDSAVRASRCRRVPDRRSPAIHLGQICPALRTSPMPSACRLRGRWSVVPALTCTVAHQPASGRPTPAPGRNPPAKDPADTFPATSPASPIPAAASRGDRGPLPRHSCQADRARYGVRVAPAPWCGTCVPPAPNARARPGHRGPDPTRRCHTRPYCHNRLKASSHPTPPDGEHVPEP